MDLIQLASAYEQGLMKFFADSEQSPDDIVIRNVKFTAYYFTELTKRWTERKYLAKVNGKEVTIEEAVERSLKATDSFFRRQDRKHASERLAATVADADDLFSFLQQKPETKEEPEKEHESGNGEAESQEASGEVASPPENVQEPVGSDHAEYAPISKEEFANIKR